jgi:hypothetical protein
LWRRAASPLYLAGYPLLGAWGGQAPSRASRPIAARGCLHLLLASVKSTEGSLRQRINSGLSGLGHWFRSLSRKGARCEGLAGLAQEEGHRGPCQYATRDLAREFYSNLGGALLVINDYLCFLAGTQNGSSLALWLGVASLPLENNASGDPLYIKNSSCRGDFTSFV